MACVDIFFPLHSAGFSRGVFSTLDREVLSGEGVAMDDYDYGDVENVGVVKKKVRSANSFCDCVCLNNCVVISSWCRCVR